MTCFHILPLLALSILKSTATASLKWHASSGEFPYIPKQQYEVMFLTLEHDAVGELDTSYTLHSLDRVLLHNTSQLEQGVRKKIVSDEEESTLIAAPSQWENDYVTAYLKVGVSSGDDPSCEAPAIQLVRYGPGGNKVLSQTATKHTREYNAFQTEEGVTMLTAKVDGFMRDTLVFVHYEPVSVPNTCEFNIHGVTKIYTQLPESKLHIDPEDFKVLNLHHDAVDEDGAATVVLQHNLD